MESDRGGIGRYSDVQLARNGRGIFRRGASGFVGGEDTAR
jgi:hypothetical protein